MTCKWCNAGFPLRVVCGVPMHNRTRVVGGSLVPCEDMPASHYAVSEREPLAYPVRIEDRKPNQIGREWHIHYSDGSVEITQSIERIRALVPELREFNRR